MDMLTIPLDTERGGPLYRQLYSYLKSEIENGTIGSGTKLPSKRVLADHLNVSLNTVQAAYSQLTDEGYVEPRERSGFYVNRIEGQHILNVQIETEAEPIPGTGGGVLYDFSCHGVDRETFPFAAFRKLAREVLDECDAELLEQGDPLGHPGLRHAIAQYLHQSRGVNCAASQVIVSSGTETLLQTLIGLLGPERTFGLENPGYDRLGSLFAGNNARFEPIDIDRQGMVPQNVAASGADVICITPAHQFPSGEIMPVSRRVQLLNWANQKEGRYIIEDDYDSEFKYSGRPIPALQGMDAGGRVIYMGAFSKSLSPALRVSYMVLPVPLLKRYLEKYAWIICPVPVTDQKILLRFIQEGGFGRHLNRMRSIYRKKREVLIRELKAGGISISGADAGLHLVARAENGFTEEQLMGSALALGVKVYGLSRYFIHSGPRDLPRVLIGFASLTEKEICEGARLVAAAWFPERTLRTGRNFDKI